MTKEEKKNNRILARQRVMIEHVNAQLKVFKLLQHTHRNHKRFELRATLIAAFVNANLTIKAA